MTASQEPSKPALFIPYGHGDVDAAALPYVLPQERLAALIPSVLHPKHWRWQRLVMRRGDRNTLEEFALDGACPDGWTPTGYNAHITAANGTLDVSIEGITGSDPPVPGVLVVGTYFPIEPELDAATLHIVGRFADAYRKAFERPSSFPFPNHHQ